MIMMMMMIIMMMMMMMMMMMVLKHMKVLEKLQLVKEIVVTQLVVY